jgi:hypothetical protein
MYKGTATFFPAAMQDQFRRDPAFNTDAGPGLTLPCVMLDNINTATRRETHLVPEGVKLWNCHTPEAPGATVDSLIFWNGRTFRVITAASKKDGWQSWMTEAVEVT